MPVERLEQIMRFDPGYHFFILLATGISAGFIWARKLSLLRKATSFRGKGQRRYSEYRDMAVRLPALNGQEVGAPIFRR